MVSNRRGSGSICYLECLDFCYLSFVHRHGRSYCLLRWIVRTVEDRPDDDAEQFLILQPMVYASQRDQQKNLSAFVVARSDPDQYGKLEVFEMPRGQLIDGPALLASEMLSDPAVAAEQTLLGREGSRIRYGNILVIPIANSLLHVRPMYVTGEGTEFPVLRRVIVSSGSRVEIAPTLEGALRQLFGDAPETLEEAPGGEGERAACSGWGSCCTTRATICWSIYRCWNWRIRYFCWPCWCHSSQLASR
mgnify:CR=1 FL=1